MTPEKPENQAQGWNSPRPENLPPPTYWPAALALSITFLFWSVVTSWVVTIVGLALFIAAISGWIREICHERKQT